MIYVCGSLEHTAEPPPLGPSRQASAVLTLQGFDSYKFDGIKGWVHSGFLQLRLTRAGSGVTGTVATSQKTQMISPDPSASMILLQFDEAYGAA